jgi:hypothetical protein
MDETSQYIDFLNQAEHAEKELLTEKIQVNAHMFQHSSDFIMNDGCVLVENDVFLRRDGYNVNKSCQDTRDNHERFEENNCIGYECLKGSFLFDPDVHNTYHNYPVFQEEKQNGMNVFCTENHQVFHNLTRRSDGRKIPDRPIQNPSFMESEKIPELQFYTCKIDYPDRKCDE